MLGNLDKKLFTPWKQLSCIMNGKQQGYPKNRFQLIFRVLSVSELFQALKSYFKSLWFEKDLYGGVELKDDHYHQS